MPFGQQPIVDFLGYVKARGRATQPDSSSPDPGSRLMPSQISAGPPILKPGKIAFKIRGQWNVPPAGLESTDVTSIIIHILDEVSSKADPPV